MTIERLAYLALKEIVKNEKRAGEPYEILKDKGIELLPLDNEAVIDYIVSNNLGTKEDYPKNRVKIHASLNAVDFVNKNNNMTFDEKLKLIYAELSNLPDSRGELEALLDRLGLEQNSHIVKEFVNHFRETGHVTIVVESKDGYDIVLTQKGKDFLYSPPSRTTFQPNVVVENYSHSIVNKGNNNTQSGSFDSGVKNENDSTVNITKEAPTVSPNPNSPTRKIQKWQLFLAIVSVITVVTLAILKKLNIL